MDSPYFNKKVEAKLEQLRQLAPAEAKDKTGQEECLTRIAEKYPFFNLLLGESYVKEV